MRHRGSEGIFTSLYGNYAVATLNVSSTGKVVRPVANETGKIIVAADCDLSNIPELLEYITKKAGEPEDLNPAYIILQLYKILGIEFLDRVDGAFAISIYDRRQDILYLIRDRLGQTPLFYSVTPRGEIIFSSEIKGILADKSIQRAVNPEGIFHYLTFQYVPNPLTGFKGISKVSPGSFVEFKNGVIKCPRYWNLNFSDKTNAKFDDCCERLRSIVWDLSSRMIEGETSYGLFLSGGIDSTIMTGLLSEISGKRLPTFSIGFEEKDYDELPYAEIVARRYNTKHNTFIVKSDMLKMLFDLAQLYDEPYADPSALPTYYLCKLAKEHVKLVFLGDGGDDLFAGYPRYWKLKKSMISDILPKSIRKPLIKLLLSLLPANADPRSSLDYIRRSLDILAHPLSMRHYRLMAHFTDEEKDELLTDDFKKLVKDSSSFSYINKRFETPPDDVDIIDRLLYTDLMTYMPGALTTKVNVAASANSIMARAPFLNRKIVEFAASLPPSFKLKGRTTKYILKHTFKKYLPEVILTRKKVGFGVPLSKWFREDLNDYLREFILEGKLPQRGYFNHNQLKKLVEEHKRGIADHGCKLWSLIMLELWHRTYIDLVI